MRALLSIPLLLLCGVVAAQKDTLLSRKMYLQLQKSVDSIIAAKQDTSTTVKFILQQPQGMTGKRRIIADTIFSPTAVANGIVTCDIGRLGYTNSASMNVQYSVQGSLPVVLCQISAYTYNTVSFYCYSLAGIAAVLSNLANTKIHIRIDGY
jgi:hypothetical protein